MEKDRRLKILAQAAEWGINDALTAIKRSIEYAVPGGAKKPRPDVGGEGSISPSVELLAELSGAGGGEMTDVSLLTAIVNEYQEAFEQEIRSHEEENDITWGN